MKHGKISHEHEGPDNSKKNADNKKLGYKIGPAKKSDQERNESREQHDDQDAARSNKKNDNR